MLQLQVALAQLRCEDGNIEANLARVREIAGQYGGSHDVVVFPEGYVLGFPDRETTRFQAQSLHGPIVRALQACARENDTTLVIGIPERCEDHVYNTTVMVSPQGMVMAYRKVHLWQGERLRVDPGDTFTTAMHLGHRVGLLICFDIEFPETARAVAALGAHVIFVTDGNMDPYGPVHHVCMRARAQENQVFMVMANRVGTDDRGTVYAGGSGVADPFGNMLVEAGREETVLSATLALNDVPRSRQVYDYLTERRVTVGLGDVHYVADENSVQIIPLLPQPADAVPPR